MVFGEDGNVVFLRFENGNDFLYTLKNCITERGLESLVMLNGIGMLRDFEIGWLNVESSEYERELISLPHELISLSGNVSLKGESLFVHLHAALSGSSLGVIGGHLFKGTVCNTIELFAMKTDSMRLTRDPSHQFSPLEFEVKDG